MEYGSNNGRTTYVAPAMAGCTNERGKFCVFFYDIARVYRTSFSVNRDTVIQNFAAAAAL
jgi:hypothetical protein